MSRESTGLGHIFRRAAAKTMLEATCELHAEYDLWVAGITQVLPQIEVPTFWQYIELRRQVMGSHSLRVDEDIEDGLHIADRLDFELD